MNYTDIFLDDLEREIPVSRRVLERIPSVASAHSFLVRSRSRGVNLLPPFGRETIHAASSS